MNFMLTLIEGYATKVGIVNKILDILVSHATDIDHAIAIVTSVLHHLEAVKSGAIPQVAASAESKPE